MKDRSSTPYPGNKVFRKFGIRFGFPIVLLVAATLIPALIPFSELFPDPFVFSRAGRWDQVEEHYRTNRPDRDYHYFMLARSREEQAGGEIDAYYNYLKAAGILCTHSPDLDGAESCLDAVPLQSKDGLLERLGLYRAAEIAADKKRFNLRYRLLGRARLTQDDPVSRMILQDLLEITVNSDPAAALELTRQNSHIDTPFIRLWKARALLANGYRDEGIRMYIDAARSTTARWIQNAILSDMRKDNDSLWNEILRHSPRDLAALTEAVSQQELREMKTYISIRDLMATARAETVRTDGLFFIASGQPQYLESFSSSAYTHLSQNPDILYDWLTRLIKDRVYGTTDSLFEKFAHTKEAHGPLWRLYLEYLEDRGRRETYFQETLLYLKHNSSDHRVHDRLIEFLIGSDHKHIHWAPGRYWENARTMLPDHSGKGRFVYWLKRYYEASGQVDRAAEIQRDFYIMAPGSYYAQAFWDEMNPGDYRNDWFNVNDRTSYLRWVGRHGGNPEALRFLSTQNLQLFLDPDALSLWNRISSESYTIPVSILNLYRIGEHVLANEFYRVEYEGKLSEMENTARLAVVGFRTGNLYLSVYYTRSLARLSGISEDPFSLPEGLLKSLYPTPHRDVVQRYSREFSIPEGMVYGLMRQESLFREQAVSRSGAKGLMQIMPRTGAWIAGKLKMDDPDYFNPNDSIRIGAKYFSDLIRQYDGDFRWAAIAYNGGPGNLRKWKKSYYTGDFNLFLENIPISEPRNYCRITYQNYLHYLVTYTLHP